MPLTPRYLGRYTQIAEILVSHGFGAILAELDLERRLGLSRHLVRRDQPLPTERSGAEHVRLALEELGPTFIKLGQILSTRPDLLPPAYLAELSLLQDRVPTEPWNKIKSCIEEELGAPIEQLFTSFDPTPLAAASLAQVHAATLPDGHRVVVKVQRPDVEKTIDLDLNILYELAQLAQGRLPLGENYNLAELAEEFATTLRAELDYRHEGRNADRFRANFADEPQLYVPKVFWDYTTRRVLVMEYISGIKIDDVAALDAAGYNRQHLALYSARFIIKELMEDGFFHADPHPGNILVMPGEVIGLIDFGTVGRLETEDRVNLIRLYIVAVQLDVTGLTEQLTRMGIVDPRADQAALRRDLKRILLKYQGLTLKDIHMREILEDARPLLYRHHLRLPSDYWLLGKTLVMMEGVGQKLAPDFDMFAVSEPYVRRFMQRIWLPSEWGPFALRSVAHWGDLLNNLPQQVNRILGQVEANQLGLQLHLPELEPATKRLDSIANRVVLSMLLAAFIVALAIVIPTLNLSWPWGLLTWVIVLSFGVMSILGLWLILSILRSGGGFK